MPKPKRRSPHGSVSVMTLSNNLHLRWSYQSQRFRLAMELCNSPINLQAARAKAAQIEQDIAREQFDETLQKYRPQSIAPTEQPKLTTTIAF